MKLNGIELNEVVVKRVINELLGSRFGIELNEEDLGKIINANALQELAPRMERDLKINEFKSELNKLIKDACEYDDFKCGTYVKWDEIEFNAESYKKYFDKNALFSRYKENKEKYFNQIDEIFNQIEKIK